MFKIKIPKSTPAELQDVIRGIMNQAKKDGMLETEENFKNMQLVVDQFKGAKNPIEAIEKVIAFCDEKIFWESDEEECDCPECWEEWALNLALDREEWALNLALDRVENHMRGWHTEHEGVFKDSSTYWDFYYAELRKNIINK